MFGKKQNGSKISYHFGRFDFYFVKINFPSFCRMILHLSRLYSSALFKKYIRFGKYFFMIYKIFFIRCSERFAGRIKPQSLYNVCLALRIHTGKDINAAVKYNFLRIKISEILGR